MTEIQFNKRGLTDLGYKLFLDRYAKKMTVAPGQPPAVGTYCLGKFNGVKEICKITARSLSNQHEVEYEIISRIDDDGQPELAGIGGYADYMSFDYPVEWDPADMQDRVAQAVASVEVNAAAKSKAYIDFKKLLADWKFLPGGRILAAAGVDEDLSFYNCFVIPSPEDSKQGIFDTAHTMSQIMSRGGGVGINISTLRPRYAPTAKTSGRSSGAVSWGEIYSFVTGLIEQGGCVVGSTGIATVNGVKPISDLVGTQPYVFTYDTEYELVTLQQASWVGKTGQQKEVWKLTTDKGLELIATPDHKILCRDGIYRELKDLKPKQSIMPLYAHHKVASVEFSHYEDVYDMEVPETHNFAVCQGDELEDDGAIFIHNSRRGALMLILEDWHPDIEEFIRVKRDMKRITNANISIGISDAFMQAVDADTDWDLIFPDTSVALYDERWSGDINTWVADGLPVKTYKTVKARDLWNQIIESAWSCAEPGLWFKDRANDYSNSWYFDPLIATNPCGEQALPAWGVCNLGAINLSKFVRDADVNWDSLKYAVTTAVRFLDNVVDLTPYHYDENAETQQTERRVGLGTMGLAEMMLKLGLRYGSAEGIAFIDKLYEFIAVTAYKASIYLAHEKGSFPKFNNKLLVSKFALGLPKELRSEIADIGLRNVTLLTQAPTGTTGTMVNTSTGIEPFYFWEWTRKGRMGEAVERVRLYDDWVTANPGKPIPSYFVTAQDLTPEEHVRVQAAIQRWVDSSISKTCNVPENYTVEQVGELYKLMYDLGCKGGTVYRDNSRNEQVLNLTKPAQQPTTTRKRPDSLVGRTYRKTTPAGTLYVTVNDREDGPFEVFLTVGKAGSELAAQAEALGRLISYILRLPSSDSPEERMQVVIGQLQDIGSGRALGFGPSRVASMADGIAQALQLYSVEAGYEWAAGQLEGHLPEGVDELIPVAPAGDLCPQCGNASFYKIEGCKKCFDCGYSEC